MNHTALLCLAVCTLTHAILPLSTSNANNLLAQGNRAYEAGEMEQACTLYKQLLDVFPQSCAVNHNYARATYELNMISSSLTSYKKALEKSPDDANIHLCYAQALLAAGNYRDGWQEYEWRWKKGSNPLDQIPYPLWQGEDLTNKTILLHSEGALGDTLQFVRYAQVIYKQGASVIVRTHRSLKQLLSLCPYIEKIVAFSDPLPVADYHASLMSLPALLNTTLKTVPTPIPYIYAYQKLIDQWRPHLTQANTKIKIGICWQADTHNDQQRPPLAQRSVALSVFQPLSELKNVTLYSLQKEYNTGDIPHVPWLIPCNNADTNNGAFMDTAAVMHHLDLIITVDTSVAHLAGALGKKTWVVLPFKSDWRWLLDRTDSPWYPTMKLLRKEKHGDWSSLIQDIVKNIPKEYDSPTPYDHLEQGTLELESKNLEDAEHHLYIALAHIPDGDKNFDSQLANALLQLGNLLFGNNKNKQALKAFDALLSVSDAYTAGHHNKGFTLSTRLGKHEEALEAYNKALTLKPDDAETRFCAGMAYLATNQLGLGWRNYRYRWQRGNRAPRNFSQPLPDELQTEDLYNKRVLLRVEQGLGDTLQFIRYAQLLKNLGAIVIAEVQKPLVKLLSYCEYLDQIIPIGSPLPSYDLQIPMLCLPYHFRTTRYTVPTNIPYLYADQDLCTQWQQYFAHEQNLKVGICWRGDKSHGASKFMPFDQFKKLAMIPGVRFYSLQKGYGAEQLDDSIPIYQFDKFDTANGPFVDTAAIMKHLDLVITVDTSVAHLAGGLGIPVWVILPFPAEWRWLTERTDSAWYPTMKLFRQTTAGEWDDVIANIETEVRTLCNNREIL